MSDTRRKFLALVDAVEPSVRAALLAAFRDIKSSARLSALEAAIDRGDIEGVIAALNLRDEFFAPLDRAIEGAFYEGGVYQLANLPGKPSADILRLAVRFSTRTPRAERWARERSGNLIREIVEDQKMAVRTAVEAGLAAGQNPRTVALALTGRMEDGKRVGGIVGLTERQAGAVTRMGAELSDPEQMSGYFSRARRDRRFDRTVRAAMKAGRPVGKADVARITQRYADRLLNLRGEMIARTETIAALNAARREAFQQMIDRGEVPESAVTRVWDATGDSRTRQDHMLMEGQTVRWSQPFVAPDGSRLMGPGDSSLGASADQVIGCRCYEQIKVNWLSLAV